MDKIGKSFRKNIVENYYRLLSVTHLTVNKVAIPTADKVSSYLQEHLKQPEEEANSGLSGALKKSLTEKILYGDELARRPLMGLAEYLDHEVVEVENKLKDEYNINTNQWMFSLENLEMLEKITTLATITFKEVQHIGKFDAIRYLSAWNMLQRLYLTSYEKRMESKKNQLDYPFDHAKVQELKKIQAECLHYSIFAHGTYGWLINNIYNGKQEFNQLLNINKRSHIDDFLFHTKLKHEAVLHSFWETTPYKPAHVITKDEIKKSIVLSIRGTDHWADAVTDLDFHYLSFSIVKDPNNGKLFIRFNYNEETQGYLKKRLGDDTRELNGETFQPLTGREEVIETGFAHAGMLVSAIGAYKEITPKLEEILSKPEHSEYNLVVTGHSLGGGMTTLMSLLYMIHPLQVMKDQVKAKFKGFSYGSASVLSGDFDKYLRDVLTTVVLGYDVVPRLSYGSVMDLCKVMLAFDEINKKDPNTFAEVMGLDTSGADFDKLQSESKGRVGKFKSLYENFKHTHMDSLKLLPMGRVFHFQDATLQPIKRENRTFDYVMREITEKEYFDEIIFSRQLVKHHFPPLYEDALHCPRVLYQRYLEKAVNKEGSSISSSSEVDPYTK